MVFSQEEFDIRCEWGLAGIEHLLAGSDAVIIVDVLSFSTCIDIATSNGAIVYPYRWKDSSAAAYAAERGAVLASIERRQAAGYSLSPTSLLSIPAGTRLVLPSPNGSTLSLATGSTPTFAACLRNAQAVAQAVCRIARRISVIPAGEHWKNGSLRPALEDLIGAGAVIHHVPGARSPEAAVAEQVFLLASNTIASYLAQCSSGKELLSRGFAQDVELAAALNASRCVPILRDGAYIQLDS